MSVARTKLKKSNRQKRTAKKSPSYLPKEIGIAHKRTAKNGDRIYDIFFSEKKKTQEEIIDIIGQSLDAVKIKGQQIVKLTFVERAIKKVHGLSYLYDVNGREGLEESITDMLDEIFRPVIPSNIPGYLRRMIRSKGFITKLEIRIEK